MSKKEISNVVNMFEEDALSGISFEANDLAIPFLSLLQSNSPQLMENKELRPGMIYDTVLKKGYEELLVIPCSYVKQYVEWTPRESGGGLKATYNASQGLELLQTCKKDDKGKDILPNGNLLVPTAVYYVIYVPQWDCQESYKAIISMTSTALKKSRRWNSMMAGISMKRKDGTNFTPPVFSHAYTLTTCAETNVHGSWFNWDISLFGPVDDENTYSEGKTFSIDMEKSHAEQRKELPF